MADTRVPLLPAYVRAFARATGAPPPNFSSYWSTAAWWANARWERRLMSAWHVLSCLRAIRRPRKDNTSLSWACGRMRIRRSPSWHRRRPDITRWS